MTAGHDRSALLAEERTNQCGPAHKVKKRMIMPMGMGSYRCLMILTFIVMIMLQNSLLMDKSPERWIPTIPTIRYTMTLAKDVTYWSGSGSFL